MVYSEEEWKALPAQLRRQLSRLKRISKKTVLTHAVADDKDELMLRSATAAFLGTDGGMSRSELLGFVKQKMGSFMSATLEWGDVDMSQYLSTGQTGERMQNGRKQVRLSVEFVQRVGLGSMKTSSRAQRGVRRRFGFWPRRCSGAWAMPSTR